MSRNIVVSATVSNQVADLILEESQHTNSVELSQAAIATLLAASRQTVNESLSRLRELGGVETGYPRIELGDRAIVAEVAVERLA